MTKARMVLGKQNRTDLSEAHLTVSILKPHLSPSSEFSSTISTTSLPSKTVGSIPFATFTTTVCMGGPGMEKETHAPAPLSETAADRNPLLASLRANLGIGNIVPNLAKEPHAVAPLRETAAKRDQTVASLGGNPILDNKVPGFRPEGSMDMFVLPGAQQQQCEIVTSTLFHFFGSDPTSA